MSYFFYVQTPSINTNFISDELQPYSNQSNNSFLFPAQNFFMTPNFGTGTLTFTEFPCFPSQQEIMIPTSHSLPNINTQVQEHKEIKKRQRNSDKEIQSAKKNSQSNLINHFFSFFNSRQKSESVVEACINSVNKKESRRQKLLHLFYNTIHVINARRGRRYVNRKNLLTLFEADELLSSVPEVKERISKVNQITIQQLCEVFRKCCFSFYRTYSIDSILTSKRISCIAKQQHFRKRRKVLKAFHDKNDQ